MNCFFPFHTKKNAASRAWHLRPKETHTAAIDKLSSTWCIIWHLHTKSVNLLLLLLFSFQLIHNPSSSGSHAYILNLMAASELLILIFNIVELMDIEMVIRLELSYYCANHVHRRYQYPILIKADNDRLDFLVHQLFVGVWFKS